MSTSTLPLSMAKGWSADARWSLTPAAADLLREQDLKPAGAAFPVAKLSEDPSCVAHVCPSGATRRRIGPRAMMGRRVSRMQKTGARHASSVNGAGSERETSANERSAGAQTDVSGGADLERFAVDYHKPVLPREVFGCFHPVEKRWFLDMTLGGAGHAEMLLAAGACVVGIDQDAEALVHAERRLAPYGRRFRPVHGSFAGAVELLEQARGVVGNQDVPEKFDGILMDLGVSSHQLDAPERGFSFLREGPLDMRMDSRAGVDAAFVVNTYEEGELIRVFREYGEEPAARRIARMIVDRRARVLFQTTSELAAAIEEVVPRRGRVHPATRVFQAIRMEVNQELDVLRRGLDAALKLLAPGGRLAVISFHSLEDRLVKQFMRHGSTAEIDRPEWPAPRANPDHVFVRGGGRHQEAREDEVTWNPRSRSAKLRCVERLAQKPFIQS